MKKSQYLHENLERIKRERKHTNKHDPSYFRGKLISILEKKADILTLTGHYENARETYQKMHSEFLLENRIQHAHMYYKIGSTWSIQRKSKETLENSEIAEEILDDPAEIDSSWWKEWINIQFIKYDAYYYTAQKEKMEKIIDKIKPVIQKYGTDKQKMYLNEQVGQLDCRKNQFIVSDETIQRFRENIFLAKKLGNLGQIGHYTFNLGFILFGNNRLNEAKEALETSLEIAKKIGSTSLQMLCVTYLTTIFRKENLLEKTKDWALRSLNIANTANIPVYIAMTKANLSWVYYQQGKYHKTEKFAKDALNIWKEVNYPFQWAAIFPLFAVLVTQQRVSEAVEYAQILIEPTQHRLPNLLESTLKLAVTSWQRNDHEKSYNYLENSLSLARKYGCL